MNLKSVTPLEGETTAPSLRSIMAPAHSRISTIMPKIINDATFLPEYVTKIITKMAQPQYVVVDGEKYTESSPDLVERLRKGKSIQFFNGFHIPEGTTFSTKHQICVSGDATLPKKCIKMFYCCEVATESDLSDFRTEQVEIMHEMFYCSNFVGDISPMGRVQRDRYVQHVLQCNLL